MAESDFNLFLVNSVTADDQRRPSVTQLANGNIMVVWDSGKPTVVGGPDYPEVDIKGRVFDSDGNQVVAEFRVNQVPGLPAGNYTGSDIQQIAPVVTALANGNVVVTYATDKSLAVARILSPNGTPITSEIALDQDSPTISRQADVIALADGGFVATWISPHGTDSYFAISARLFNANGTPRTDEFVVSQVNVDHQQFPSVTELANGNIGFAWQTDGTYHIKGRVFDLAGDPVTNEYQVSTGVSGDINHSRWNTKIAALDNGNQVVVWGEASDIKVHVMSAAGGSVSAVFDANTYDPTDPTAIDGWQPDVIALADGRFLVAWANGYAGIRARVFNADGTEAVPEFDISPAASLDAQQEGEVEVIQLADGRLMFTWEEFTDEADGNGTGIEAVIMKLPTYDYATGQFVSVGSESVDDINGILVQDTGQDDLVIALDGNDVVDGGDGNDTIYGDSAPAGSASAAALSASSGSEIAASTGKGKDKLFGGAGNDKIYGGGGKDKLKGEDGKDKLSGGKGKDTLIGGKDADKFIFAPHEGKDKVKDFGKGKDKLDLRDFDFNSKADALDAFSDAGKHTVFKAEGTKIVLKGFDHDDLGGGDLII